MSKLNRPITTLFMLESLDGKISTGDNDELDTDKDFKRITGIKEGVHQYYDIEKTTDLFSLNSGRVMAKIGINERTTEPAKMEVNFIIIDNKPHLTEKGIIYLAKWVSTLYLVTTNKNHPAFELQKKHNNIKIIFYEHTVDLVDLMEKMKTQYQADRITIQSGGTLNAEWLRQGLIDQVSIVIAPCLIGGKNTQSLIGGESLHTQADLKHVKALKLVFCEVLKDSFIHVVYDVIKETEIVEIS
jgi:2,5-diamino-6-(ribosylamino)-4(3H)-pyrimidinone 5'-phosphate reductase